MSNLNLVVYEFYELDHHSYLYFLLPKLQTSGSRVRVLVDFLFYLNGYLGLVSCSSVGLGSSLTFDICISFEALLIFFKVSRSLPTFDINLRSDFLVLSLLSWMNLSTVSEMGWSKCPHTANNRWHQLLVLLVICVASVIGVFANNLYCRPRECIDCIWLWTCSEKLISALYCYPLSLLLSSPSLGLQIVENRNQTVNFLCSNCGWKLKTET